MRKIFSIFLLLLIFTASLFCAGRLLAAMTSTGGYQIWADVISDGGSDGTLSDSNYNLGDTIGEGLIGESSSSATVLAGFRAMETASSTGSISLNISPSSLSLGSLSATSVASSGATLSFMCSASGARVYFTGSTLTSGGNTISGIGATAVSSTPGTSQFGFNAIYQSGDSGAQSVSPYNSTGKYAFHSGDDIISATSDMSATASFGLNYIANISSGQASGDYSTTLTFTAIGDF